MYPESSGNGCTPKKRWPASPPRAAEGQPGLLTIVYCPTAGHVSVVYVKSVETAGSGGPGFFLPTPKVIFEPELQGMVTRCCEKQLRLRKNVSVRKQHFIVAIFNQARLHG